MTAAPPFSSWPRPTVGSASCPGEGGRGGGGGGRAGWPSGAPLSRAGVRGRGGSAGAASLRRPRRGRPPSVAAVRGQASPGVSCPSAAVESGARWGERGRCRPSRGDGMESAGCPSGRLWQGPGEADGPLTGRRLALGWVAGLRIAGLGRQRYLY